MKPLRVFFAVCLFLVVQTLAAQMPPQLGVKITCPYMPYGPNASQIIYLTNSSTNDVNIVVNAFDENGNQFDLGMVGVAPERRVVTLASIVNNELLVKGFTGTKAALEFTLTNSAVRGHCAYVVGSSDRGYVAPTRELFPLSGQTTNAPTTPALGLKITCPYMPYSASAAQIIYLANPSTRNTDIKVKAYDDGGNEFDLGVVGIATARKVTKLATILNEALLNKGFNGSGKITFEFDCDNPEIIGHFEYNVGSTDRGYVESIRELYVLPPAAP